jgi:ribonuclease BN (tRNA processing enzyme)
MLEPLLSQFELPRAIGSWSGSSRAGSATAFRWETKIQFDAGIALWPSRPKHLFLTHTHADHVQCLCQELMRGGGSSLCQVYFPAAEERKIVAHLQAFRTLVRDDDDETTTLEAFFNIKLKPVAKGSELRIERDVIVRVVEGTHRKVCNGYSLLREKKKLKAEYIGRDGAELGALRKQGVEISQVEWEPLFCFLGDTRPDVFRHHPELLQTHHTIMMECTFCGDPSKAAETGHTDWSELELIMAANPHVLFVLQHFSMRYSDRYWEQLLKGYNQQIDAAANAHLMLPGLECLCFQCKPKQEVTST